MQEDGLSWEARDSHLSSEEAQSHRLHLQSMLSCQDSRMPAGPPSHGKEVG